MKKSQNVTIKGTKDGITLHLDDSCSYEELKNELDNKLSANMRVHDDDPFIRVKVQMGNRYLSSVQREEITELIREKRHFIVDEIVTNVITMAEAKKMREETEIVSVNRIVRSGQVVEVPGDLLLLGDVNPGGEVKAGGNIFVMGNLKGVAHAGFYGNHDAVIVASTMKPQQLRISQFICGELEFHNLEDKRLVECAYLDDNRQIVVDKIQTLMQLRPNLTRLEGGH